MLENPGPLLSWLWTEPSWIHLSHGDMLVIGSLIVFGTILGIINKIRTGESGFF